MRIERTIRNNIAIISLEGRIDGKSVPDLRVTLLFHLQTVKDAVFDLSKVDHLSSSGLRLLLLASRYSAVNSGRLIFTGIHKDLISVMSQTGFLPFLRVADTEEQAMKLLL